MTKLTHLDDKGAARMVDVGGKAETKRSATAEGRIVMQADTLAAVRDGSGPKGDVLAAARIAGISSSRSESRTSRERSPPTCPRTRTATQRWRASALSR